MAWRGGIKVHASLLKDGKNAPSRPSTMDLTQDFETLQHGSRACSNGEGFGLLDHLIGAGEKLRRDFEAESFSRLEIDD
jgi:hypothetical protein